MLQNAENRPPAPLPQALPLPAGQVPMIYNRPPKKVYTKYNNSCVRGMSITLIVLGIVCFAVQFADFFFFSAVKYSGAGIWGGLFYIVTGSLGVVSSDKRTTCTIVTFMVLCIIGSVIGTYPLGIGATGLGMGIVYGYGNQFHYYYNYGPGVLTAGQVHYMAGPNGETQVMIMPVNQNMTPSNFAPSTTNSSGYIHPGQPAGSAPPVMVHPPAYEEQASPPEYEIKKLPEMA